MVVGSKGIKTTRLHSIVKRVSFILYNTSLNSLEITAESSECIRVDGDYIPMDLATVLVREVHLAPALSVLSIIDFTFPMGRQKYLLTIEH